MIRLPPMLNRGVGLRLQQLQRAVARPHQPVGDRARHEAESRPALHGLVRLADVRRAVEGRQLGRDPLRRQAPTRLAAALPERSRLLRGQRHGPRPLTARSGRGRHGGDCPGKSRGA